MDFGAKSPIISISRKDPLAKVRRRRNVKWATSESALASWGRVAIAPGIEGERFALLSFRPPAVLILGLHPSPPFFILIYTKKLPAEAEPTADRLG